MLHTKLAILVIALAVVAQATAAQAKTVFDLRFGANEQGNGTYNYLELTRPLENGFLLDGWYGNNPTPLGVNHQLTLGVGHKLISKGPLTLLGLAYADRQTIPKISYSTVPALVSIINTKRFHIFLAPKLFLAFNSDAPPTLVINPIYVGFRWKGFMGGFSGTFKYKIESKHAEDDAMGFVRCGGFIRYGGSTFVELRALDLKPKDAGSEFLIRIVFENK